MQRHSTWLGGWLFPVLALLAIGLVPLRAGAAEQFSFVALGDTTYEVPQDDPVYVSLIGAINAAAPAFSIHIGDTKGWGLCDDAFQLKQRAYFDSFEAPVVYTPGNNEWSDCWKENRGSMDPIAVLDSMRRIFWSKSASMGKKTLPLRRQADGDDFPAFSENALWQTEDVTFATIDVVGENNNQFSRDETLWREFVERERANVAWVREAFRAARDSGDKAVVIAMHSDIFLKETDLPQGPFKPVLDAIAEGAESFPGQVLVVHGHRHQFMVDRPLRKWSDEDTSMTLENLTRLQVYGWPEMKAVRVSVDTSKPWVFGFEPLYSDSNLSPAFTD
ncbi:MAG: hypothetical protein PVI46_15395 [Lysobacterales bacterium]